MFILQRLNSSHKHEVTQHLLRLDKQSRYTRFCFPIKDDAIILYVEHMNFEKNGIWGLFKEKHLIGLGECIFGTNGSAEVAFSVDKEYRNQGLGGKIMNTIVEFAYKNNATNLQMFCLEHNAKTSYLAKKYGFTLNTQYGQSHAMVIFPEEKRFHQLLSSHSNDVNQDTIIL